MPHLTSQTAESLLEIFDPTLPQYADVREHFTVHELEKIDEIRAYPPGHQYTLQDKLTILAADTKALLTSVNASPDE